MTWSKDVRDDWGVGDVCTHISSGNWYVVRRVGAGGGCYGPCFYGSDANIITCSGLRARCDRVEPDQLPDRVAAALAVFALTGKPMRLAG